MYNDFLFFSNIVMVNRLINFVFFVSVKIGLFYVIYYAFLAGFFMGMLLIFYQTLDDKVRWSMKTRDSR